LVETVLKYLPSQVEVTSSGDWKHSQVYEALPGTIKITERQGSDDYSYTNEYYSDGVRPKGYAVLADILTKAFAECGYTQMRATTLLSK
jgi:hypothetical protein